MPTSRPSRPASPASGPSAGLRTSIRQPEAPPTPHPPPDACMPPSYPRALSTLNSAGANPMPNPFLAFDAIHPTMPPPSLASPSLPRCLLPAFPPPPALPPTCRPPPRPPTFLLAPRTLTLIARPPACVHRACAAPASRRATPFDRGGRINVTQFSTVVVNTKKKSSSDSQGWARQGRRGTAGVEGRRGEGSAGRGRARLRCCTPSRVASPSQRCCNTARVELYLTRTPACCRRRTGRWQKPAAARGGGGGGTALHTGPGWQADGTQSHCANPAVPLWHPIPSPWHAAQQQSGLVDLAARPPPAARSWGRSNPW